MRFLKWILPLGIVLYLLTGVVEVRRGERAVVRRFGRVLAEQPEPGLWVGLPWGMDRVDRVEVDGACLSAGGADRFGNRLGGLELHVRDHHLRAFARHQQRGSAADAHRGAGDDRHLVLQTSHRSLLEVGREGRYNAV